MLMHSIDSNNLVESLRDRLISVGYQVHNGEGDTSSNDWWWTWTHPYGHGDIECGPDCTSAMAAWQSAMEDFFSEVTAHHGS